jgi:DNA-binding response OmpR family regulator
MARRVLIVDDDARLCRTLCRVLSYEGLEVREAATACDAVSAVRRVRFDAIVLDWALPDGEGPDVVRTLRTAGVTCPVIMLTGRAEVEDKERALEAGADDYCLKPPDLRELVARVRAHIRRGSGEYASLTAGRIEVDAAARVATVDGNRVDVTGIELHLLSILVRRAGEVVPRAYILQEVWQDTSDGIGHHKVDVHMGRLRTKLGLVGEQIETLYGAGFRLNLTKT